MSHYLVKSKPFAYVTSESKDKNLVTKKRIGLVCVITTLLGVLHR